MRFRYTDPEYQGLIHNRQYEKFTHRKDNYNFKNYKRADYIKRHSYDFLYVKQIHDPFAGTLDLTKITRKKWHTLAKYVRIVLTLCNTYKQDQSIMLPTTNLNIARLLGYEKISPKPVSRMIDVLQALNILKLVDKTYWFSTTNGEIHQGKSRIFNFNKRAGIYFLKCFAEAYYDKNNYNKRTGERKKRIFKDYALVGVICKYLYEELIKIEPEFAKTMLEQEKQLVKNFDKMSIDEKGKSTIVLPKLDEKEHRRQLLIDRMCFYLGSTYDFQYILHQRMSLHLDETKIKQYYDIYEQQYIIKQFNSKEERERMYELQRQQSEQEDARNKKYREFVYEHQHEILEKAKELDAQGKSFHKEREDCNSVEEFMLWRMVESRYNTVKNRDLMGNFFIDSWQDIHFYIVKCEQIKREEAKKLYEKNIV